jgi:hypothetical protein
MKIIVAGSRDITDFNYIETSLCELINTLNISSDIEIVSGKAIGVDTLGKDFARKHCYKLKEFPADWSLGKGAGYIRNIEMAKYADMLVAFWNGKSKGTKHMIDIATKRGLIVYVYKPNEENKLCT